MAAYSVGGTVSGLSGTVVLQDNGGDNLSVSASGGFTFATGLAAGSAYNVTVKTYLAGQTCSVANGSGMVGRQHHQRRRHLHDSGRLFCWRHGVGPVRHGGAAGQWRR